MGNLQLAVYVCIPFASIILFSILKANRSSSTSLPGPRKLPVIGNIHHLISLLPLHHHLTYLDGKYGMEGILGLQIGQLPVVVVSSSSAARDVLTGKGFLDRFETLAIKILSYNNTNLAFSPHGSHRTKILRICKEKLLLQQRVDTFRRIRETESANFVQSISESAGNVINLSERIFSLVISITFQASFGGGDDNREILGEFVSAIQNASVLSGKLDVCDLFPGFPFSWYRSAVQKAHNRLDKIVEEIIGGRNIRRGDDDDDSAVEQVGDGGCLSLIDVLLRGQDDFRLTIDQIKPVILDVFMAGTETSSTIIEWAMSELIRNPDIMVRAQVELREVIGNRSEVKEEDIEQLPFLDAIFKETLRLHPPTPLIPRQANEDTKILEHHIPRKTKVLINAWAIGRDPQDWEDAEKFEPERFYEANVQSGRFDNKNYTFIPFGGGSRTCPGRLFGKANVMLPLAQLLFHFDWSLPGGLNFMELDMDEGNGATVGRKNHLRLVATNRVN